MLISVVVPIYNVQDYLPACLDSLACQTFTDFEVILVNDGSEDDSGKICRRFMRESTLKTTLVEQKNAGLFKARWAGFKLAQGEYLVSLDSDDMLAPGALGAMADAIRTTGCDVVLFAHSLRRDFSEPVAPALEHGQTLGRSEFLSLFADGRIANALWLKCFKKTCLDLTRKVDRLDGFCLGEDIAYSSLVLDRAESMTYVGKALYFYRTDNVSITRKTELKHLRDMDRNQSALLDRAQAWSEEFGDESYARNALKRCRTSFRQFCLQYCRGRSLREAADGLKVISKADCFARAWNKGADVAECGKRTAFVLTCVARRRFAPVWLLAQSQGRQSDDRTERKRKAWA